MLNFPSSPTLNEEYNYLNRTWVWNGVGWSLKPVTLTSEDVTTALGFTPYNASNPSGYITSAVTSVNGAGTVNGLTLTGTVTSSGDLTLGGTLNLSAPPAIGGTTPNTGVFTNLTVNDNTILGSNNTDTVNFNARVNSDIDPSTNNAYDLGRNAHAWRNLYLTGTANIAALTASGAVTLNGGTVNGVAYLNGSKVLTSGSALTFDGTNLAVSGTVTATQFNGSAAGLTGLKTVNGNNIIGSGDIVIAAVNPQEIKTPANVTPANDATDVTAMPYLTGSTYLSLYGVAMAAGQWQVSTVSNFATTVVDTGDVPGTSVSYVVPSGLVASTSYFWRVRYKDENGVYSDWSTPTSFTTAVAFNTYIPTPTATPANFGDPLEGGFYAGMIWNEITQSATSTTIGTGTRAFTVADMTSAPIVYGGQSVEVRSRANPANRMQGTVTGAIGTTLTINVDTVTGSGTFTDWSVMARHRVIVAPKAFGESASLAYKNASTAAPAACITLTEGRRATLAMVAADSATVYPAAHFCNNLNIGGRTDWYLPARDELELCWRNLKPTTDDNYTEQNRPTDAAASYQTLGSFGDTANTHGLNNNSAPTGAAYTSTVPERVANESFQSGGAEAFTYQFDLYWSSTQYDASAAWNQSWASSDPGIQYYGFKSSRFRVRAIRRSII